MSGAGRDDALRGAVRELLGELLPRSNGAGAHGEPDRGADVVPAVPAPPVAAVLRPSTWRAPAAPGEVIGDGDARGWTTGPGRETAGPGRETAHPGAVTITNGAGEVTRIDDDVDLNGFARALAERVQDPGTLDAIRAGRLRFSLERSGGRVGAAPSGDAPAHADTPGPTRTVTGPVTERTIKAAAADGVRLVLGPGAVLTPLARDCARSLGVRIEKERGC